MQFVIRAFLVLATVALFLPEPGTASVIFKPGQKAKYVAPGEEELSGNAAELYQIGQTAEKEGNPKRALRAYKSLIKHHTKDSLLTGSQCTLSRRSVAGTAPRLHTSGGFVS